MIRKISIAILLAVLMSACSSAPVALVPDGSNRVPVNKTMPQPQLLLSK